MMSKKMSMNSYRGTALLKTDWLLLGAWRCPWSFCRAARRTAAPETQVTVQAEHPEQGAIAEHITADAVLAPLAQAAIAPKISAPVRKFYVQRGARVKEGQLLATLENNDLAAAALDNKGSYMAAEAAYATATKAQVPEDTH
jgi:HlyD family secretion protein